MGRLYGEQMEKLKVMWLPRVRHVYLVEGLPVPVRQVDRQLLAVSAKKADERVIQVSTNQVDEQTVVTSATVVTSPNKEAEQMTPPDQPETDKRDAGKQEGVKQEANKPDALLIKEMDETNNWARLGAQLYFGWFTLMLTINGFATSWLFTNRGPVPRFARLLFFIFFVLNLMGTIVTILIRKHMLESDQRIQDVLVGLTRDHTREAHYVEAQSPMPRQAINTVFVFTGSALFLLVLFWMILALWPEAFLA